MAGIGFELRKLFVGRGVFRKVWAYACAGGVSSGTTLLAVLLLLGIQTISRQAGNSDYDVLLVFIIYAMLISLLASSLLNQLLSRYTADMLYQEQFDRVLPSLYGGYLLLAVPFGALYAWLLSTAGDVAVADRALNWFIFMEMLLVWLQMAYITALKRYKQVLGYYFIGVVLVLLVSLLCVLGLHMPPLSGVQLGIFIGYGAMLMGFTHSLHAYFDMGRGSLFHFLGWIEKYPELLVTGFFTIAASFSHQFVMWTSELGMQVTGLYYQAPLYDAVAFYGFLVSVPTQINFIVSMEVVFYEKYRAYFQEITGGGTLKAIGLARDEMLAALRRETFQMEAVQLLFMMIYMMLMRFFLTSTGFTQAFQLVFFLLCIGYSAQVMASCVMLLQLYFDDRKGAMVISLIGFGLTLGLTLYTRTRPELYGASVAIAGVATLVCATIRLIVYTKRIDNRVFCDQPIFAEERHGLLTRLSAALDRHAKAAYHEN